MSTLNGILKQSVAYVVNDASRWSDNLGLTKPYQPSPFTAGVSAGGGTQGSKSDTWIDHFRLKKGALPMPSFSDDYYHRIHVTPRKTDLGFVSSPTEKTVEVWNSYFETKHLTSIDESATGGITYAGVTTPHNYLMLESKIYTFTVSNLGPSEIIASYQFTFSDAEDLDTKFFGMRTLLFSYEPNWVHPVSERLEFLTEVTETRNGKEQRISLRSYPRQAVEFTLLAHDNAMNQLDSMMFKWQGRAWSLPLWFHAQRLQQSVPVASSTLVVDTEGYEFLEGSTVSIILDFRTHESFQIAAVNAGSLTLVTSTTKEWPANCLVVPVRTGWIPDDIVKTRITSNAVVAPVRFQIEDHKVTAPNEPIVYRDSPVLTLIPNRVEDMQETWARKAKVIDQQTSQTFRFDLLNFSQITRSHDFTQLSRAAVKKFRDFILSQSGRWKAFWAPTYNQDMVVAQFSSGVTNTLFIEWQGYSDNYQLHATRRDIAIWLRNGQVLYRRIVAADDEASPPGMEALTLDQVFGYDISKESVIMISFLVYSRFDNDAFEINWHMVGVAGCRALIKGVIQ